jgi:hypothetical protein
MRIRDPGRKNSDPGWKISDPGSGMKKFGYEMENGSGINISDPQYWYNNAKWLSALLACREVNSQFDRRIPFGNSSLSSGD